MKLEFNSLEEACDFAYEVRFKALLQAKSVGAKVDELSTKKESVPKTVVEKPAEKEPIKEEPEAVTGEVIQYTQAEVRAKLTELSRAGRAKEVKKLLTDAGATNVTALEPSKYAEVMEKAGEL